MRNLLILSCSLLFVGASAQDNFSGIGTSRRVGILNVGLNPAELSNLSSKYEFNLFGFSSSVTNNKIGFKDLTGDEDLEDLIFEGDETVNLRLDGEVYGPSFAFRLKKWGFGIITKSNIKVGLVDITPDLADAINLNTIAGSTTISSDYNQRINGTTWGEVGFAVSRNLIDTEKNKLSVGSTIKLLFPGSYINLGLNNLKGRIDTDGIGNAYLNDVHDVSLNIAYSGNLAENFNDADSYTKAIFGSFSGIGADIGFNYQRKDAKGYRLNAGLSVRNIGAMTYKDDNNSSTDYTLNIPNGTPTQPGLNLTQFDGAESIEDIEQVLLDSGYLDKSQKSSADFKTKLPTVFNAYVDYKVVPTFYVSLFTQQKLGSDNNNDQATVQNVITLTPRFSLKNFELYVPLSSNEIAGTAAGFGLRFYGFYVGSGSIITALTSDSKQMDLNIGYRLGLK
ncbi:MAG: DUF5723 family protein [Bacteroidota bacterium]